MNSRATYLCVIAHLSSEYKQIQVLTPARHETKLNPVTSFCFKIVADIPPSEITTASLYFLQWRLANRHNDPCQQLPSLGAPSHLSLAPAWLSLPSVLCPRTAMLMSCWWIRSLITAVATLVTTRQELMAVPGCKTKRDLDWSNTLSICRSSNSYAFFLKRSKGRNRATGKISMLKKKMRWHMH